MGFHVHIHVVFACDSNDAVAALAQSHLLLLKSHPQAPYSEEAQAFLAALSERSGFNEGPKGGLSLWGMVGNYTSGEEFCHTLEPFWTDLLRKDLEGGPGYFEHILVFVEPQEEPMEVFEIYLEEKSGGEMGELVTKHYTNMPFRANQF